MQVLVTGATGLVGNNVVRELIARKHSVRVLLRHNSSARPLQDLSVEKSIGDICDLNSLRNACHEVDAVVHAAGYITLGWTELEKSRAINVDGSRNVAVAARECNARMIHVSSVDALGAGTRDVSANEVDQFGAKIPCAYVVTKREAEEAMLDECQRGSDIVIVNPSFMLGPWDWKPSSGRMLLNVAHGFIPLAPSGGFNVCDVRDVATGIVNTIELGKTRERYILGGHNITYFDAWCLFAAVTQSKKPWGKFGIGMGSLLGTWGDLCSKISGREPAVNSASIKMARLFHYYSSDKAQTELGYTYRPLEESVRDAWHWFKNQGNFTQPIGVFSTRDSQPV